MKMIKVDDVIEYCESDIPPLRARGQSAAVAALRRVIAVAKEYAVDAEPVKHGRWIHIRGCWWQCSNCEDNLIYTTSDRGRTEKHRYCSKCGARMDGDKNDT